MQKKENIVVISELDFTYADAERPALKGIEMQVRQGDFLGVIGPSGAGKTTLAYCINGVIPHYHYGDYYGSVLLEGHDTFKTSLTDLARIAATVFQDIDAQMVASVVEDEILFGLENFGVPHNEIPERMDEALEMVGIYDLKERSLETLSGGQKQKVALAAVLALKPKVLLLDEPTGELDPQSSHRVFTLLKHLNEAHRITVIVIEQKVGLLARFATHLAVLHEGSLCFFGETREVLAHAETLGALGIGVPWVTTLPALLREEGFTQDRECCLSVIEATGLIRKVIER